jgi:hypothetical protein
MFLRAFTCGDAVRHFTALPYNTQKRMDIWTFKHIYL